MLTINDIATISDKIVDIVGMEVGMTRQFMIKKNRYFVSCAVENPKKIAYFKDSRTGMQGNPWDPEYRKNKAIMSKAGKFFRHILPDSSDSVIQKLVSKYYSIVSIYCDNSFSLHLSDDIKKYYHTDSYIGLSGPLGCSCMRYSSCQEYLDFYDNYDVSILVLKNDDDKIKGRALIWHNVYFPSLEKSVDFMDRVYVCNDNDTELFKNYAMKNDMVCKEKQSMTDKVSFQYGETFFYDVITIDGKSDYYVEDDYTPYLDTMTYSTYAGNLCNESNREYSLCLESTVGRIRPAFVCDNCGEAISEDETCSADNDSNIYCPDCFSENYCQCDDCGEFVNRNNIYATYRDNMVCECCLDNYTECVSCDEYQDNDYVYETVDGNYVCKNCLDDYVKCDECGLYDTEKYMTEIDDGYYCCICAAKTEKSA